MSSSLHILSAWRLCFFLKRFVNMNEKGFPDTCFFKVKSKRSLPKKATLKEDSRLDLKSALHRDGFDQSVQYSHFFVKFWRRKILNHISPQQSWFSTALHWIKILLEIAKKDKIDWLSFCGWYFFFFHFPWGAWLGWNICFKVLLENQFKKEHFPNILRLWYLHF